MSKVFTFAALMGFEILVIALALRFHLVELRNRTRVDGGASAKDSG